MWLLYNKGLVTKLFRRKWSYDSAIICSLCGMGIEDIKHLIISCEVSKEVCYSFGNLVGFSTNFRSIEEMWSNFRIQRKQFGGTPRGKILMILPHALCWSVWRERNDCVFRGTKVYVQNIALRVLSLHCHWCKGLLQMTTEVIEVH
uniref:Isoamyl acetate-hydrolyzing esterase 1 n=1 Tax=Anthurium amnicola TaxID=1678845 RepID=A0A1D1YNH0_9ARAE